ncbi:MAG: amidohydrolase [Candidatus Marinimicrobia bacterium CG08_land_8_20_14_0_20_45_22]|nr:MAG: amidohydrolase [Candidatus Marinimicrobia bacterium CG08_land_8_20_14_0_20_45_22]
MISQSFLSDLIDLRREIHRHPELSNEEQVTAERLIRFISAHSKPSQIVQNIGGHGFLVVFDSGQPGITVAIRTELDALPIHEKTDLPYKSEITGISHHCGHDGQMTILAGLAHLIAQQPLKSGKVILIFQPAEETGEGARRVLADTNFSQFPIDLIFGFHNLPGFPFGKVIIKDRTFSAASCGMIATLTGHPSHASHPESAVSPALAMAETIQALNAVHHAPDSSEDFTLLTVIHARLGEVAFGTTPGDAVVMATLRAYTDNRLNFLKSETVRLIQGISEKHHLACEFSYRDVFPSCINQTDAIRQVRNAAKSCGMEITELEKPFRWSEDFGYFTSRFPGAYFGIGAGKNHPDLHDAAYDFPDGLIELGLTILHQLIASILG